MLSIKSDQQLLLECKDSMRTAGYYLATGLWVRDYAAVACNDVNDQMTVEDHDIAFWTLIASANADIMFS